MRVIGLVVTTAAVPMLLACGSSDNSKVEKVINDQLAKSPTCTDVPIGQKVDFAKVGADGALGILKSKGYITESQGSSKDFWGRVGTFDTFALTDKGKPFMQRDGIRGPCVRTGHYEITKIEAIDVGNDIEGKPIASVRARVRFVPEEWISGTKNEVVWSGYWKGVSDSENAQWLYRLLKSGDNFYPYGPGLKLQ